MIFKLIYMVNNLVPKYGITLSKIFDNMVQRKINKQRKFIEVVRKTNQYFGDKNDEYDNEMLAIAKLRTKMEIINNSKDKK